MVFLVHREEYPPGGKKYGYGTLGGRFLGFFKKITLGAGMRGMVILGYSLSTTLQGATYTAVVTDLKTGMVLAESQAHKAVYPASLTKMMTLYLTFEALSRGKISLETPFSVSSLASKQPPSKWGLRRGQNISVRQCILALSVKSSNDVAYVVAENLAKTMPDFVQTMNAKALALGMTHTSFRNPSGWHHPLQTSSAYDMALLLRAICMDFPQYAGFLGVASLRRGNNTIHNTNKLLGRVPGVFLGKTGFTCPAGWNLATATNRGGKKIIAVVMGMPSRQQRDKLMAHLIETRYTAPEKLTLAIQEPSRLMAKTILAAGAQPKKRRNLGPKSRGGKKTVVMAETAPLGKKYLPTRNGGMAKIHKKGKLGGKSLIVLGADVKNSFKKTTVRRASKVQGLAQGTKKNTKKKVMLSANNANLKNRRIKPRKHLKKQMLCKPVYKKPRRKKIA